jgi:folate-binding protein YgfZ
MNSLHLREFHQSFGAQFTTVNGVEAVAHYGDVLAEHAALRNGAGVLDLSFRSRLCLVGADRAAFLHGQVTNDVQALKPGSGCYAALVSAKGKMQSDLNIYCLADELLLDFEPGLTSTVSQRLEKYIITEDVQLVDAAPHYGLLSVQGPKAAEVVRALGLAEEFPARPKSFAAISDATLGQLYLMNHPRTGTAGFDLFAPTDSLGAVADKLVAAARAIGGCACGWEALEVARIEAGSPRFGADMDESTLPPEAGLEARAISYSKGCYIGQEVIARIRTYGQVAKSLRGLRFASDVSTLPVKGDKLFKDGKEVGFITSATHSPTLGCSIALGYVRREANQTGNALVVQSTAGETKARIVELPFLAGG